MTDLAVGGNSNSFYNAHSCIDMLDGLEMIPEYYATELTSVYLCHAYEYLNKAFESPFHPLAKLLSAVCDCFAATYVSNVSVPGSRPH